MVVCHGISKLDKDFQNCVKICFRNGNHAELEECQSNFHAKTQQHTLITATTEYFDWRKPLLQWRKNYFKRMERTIFVNCKIGERKTNKICSFVVRYESINLVMLLFIWKHFLTKLQRLYFFFIHFWFRPHKILSLQLMRFTYIYKWMKEVLLNQSIVSF